MQQYPPPPQEILMAMTLFNIYNSVHGPSLNTIRTVFSLFANNLESLSMIRISITVKHNILWICCTQN